MTRTVLLCTFLFIFTSPLPAQIPRTISYQGILTDTSGTPIPDASYVMMFRLYLSSSGGTEVWSENKVVQVKGGLFSTSLGDVTPFSGSLLFNSPYWLSLQLGATPEMAPRITMTTTPYALSSEKADSARVAGGVAPNAVTTSGIADNAVTGAKIQNGSIQFADIGQNGAASGQVMKWNGSSWTAGNDSVGTAGSTGPWQLNGTSAYYSGGNVGIGTSNPGFPLNFAQSSGDKLSLWGQSGPHYGFGIQGGQFQIHTDVAASDILFGYGTSAAFTERMRIKGNGNVGIGINNPNAPLAFAPSLGKKITLYPGATGDVGFGVAGNRLQIYSDNPNADVAIGYDAAGTFNERFAVKPNGALAVNGSIGGAGQVLQSNGNAPATWSNKPYIISYTQSGAVDLQGSGVLDVPLPGLDNQAISLTQTSTVVFMADLNGHSIHLINVAYVYTRVQIVDAGAQIVASAESHEALPSLRKINMNVIGMATLPPGIYSIRVVLAKLDALSGIARSEPPGKLIIQVFPQ